MDALPFYMVINRVFMVVIWSLWSLAKFWKKNNSTRGEKKYYPTTFTTGSTITSTFPFSVCEMKQAFSAR